MLSSSLTPRVVRHGSFYRNVTKFFVLDIYFSDHLLERHLFTNKRDYLSMFSCLSAIMPSYYKNSNRDGLCFDSCYSIDISFLDEFSRFD